MKTIGVIGGDLRQLTISKEFEKEGFGVFTYGLTGLGATNDERAFCADIIILPVPVGTADKLNAPFEEDVISISRAIKRFPKNSLVFGGKFPNCVKSELKSMGITYFDYLERPEFPVYNAVPTAEGAIEIAISETPYTIHESKILITGYGNISKCLAYILKTMGAEVYISLRNKKQAADAECMGLKTLDIADISDYVSEFDIIFNTVPALIFTGPVLEEVSPDSLIIDLASKPGGVDFENAQLLSKRVIWALSLPGKVAPVTSGIIIKRTIKNILNERK